MVKRLKKVCNLRIKLGNSLLFFASIHFLLYLYSNMNLGFLGNSSMLEG